MSNVEPTTEQRATKAGLKRVSHVNRIGHEYFVHQGVTKTGKPKYFASQKPSGAMASLPDGFIFGESINGIVTIQRPKPSLIPEADIVLIRQKVAEFRHLSQCRVEAKDNAIFVYEPTGMDAIKSLNESKSWSMLESVKAMIGPAFQVAIAKTAADMGMTVAQLKRVDALVASEKRSETTQYLMRNLQFDSVMRFIHDPVKGPYRVERRSYRGDHDWASLGFGPLNKMANKYIKHIGKESFFDLM